MSPAEERANGPVAVGFDAAARQWRLFLALVAPVIVAGRLVTDVLTVVAPDGKALILNGRFEAKLPSWAIASLSANDWQLVVPLPMIVAWGVALLLGIALAGDAIDRPGAGGDGPGPRVGGAWRRAVRRWAAVGVLLVLALAAVLVAIVGGLAYLEFGAVGAVAVAGIGGLLLTRPVLALPVAVLEPVGVVQALRRGTALMRSAQLGGPVFLGVGVIPAGVVWIAGAGGQLLPYASTLPVDLALICVVPLQAAALTYAFVWARDTRMPEPVPVQPNGWRRVAGPLALTLVSPILVTAAVTANPYGVPVVAVSESLPHSGDQPLWTGVLADGSPVIVGNTSILRCLDPECDASRSISLPCIDGAQPEPSNGGRSCAIEAPIDAATVRPDGTVIALRRDNGSHLRLLSCRLSAAQMCEWIGATALHDFPARWTADTTALVSTPDGGLVVATMAPPGDLLIIRCEQPCLNHSERTPATIPGLPGDSPPADALAIAIDPSGQQITFALRERRTSEILIGTCPLDCTNATLRRLGPTDPLDSRPTAKLVVTQKGPMLVLAGVVVTCSDVACEGWVRTEPTPGQSEPHIVVTPAGEPILVTRNDTGVVISSLTTGRTTRLPLAEELRLIGSAVGPDGRLHVFASGPSGLTALTCDDIHCGQ